MIKQFGARVSALLAARLSPLPAGFQRVIYVGVPFVSFLLVIALLLPNSPTHQVESGTLSKSGGVGSVLLNGTEGEDTVQALTAAIQRLGKHQDETAKELEDLRASVAANARRPVPPSDNVASVTPAPPAKPPASAPPAGTASKQTTGASPASFSVRPGLESGAGLPAGDQIPAALSPASVWGPPSGDVQRSAAGGVAASPLSPTVGIVHVFKQESVAAPVARTGPPASADIEPVFELPPGAILSGVLLTGLDAPTATQARRDPVPALLRIKAETILPNRHEADQRECFVLLSGYGDLSSERAYLRAEDLSCILADGATFHARIEGFVTDETGRIGVRGPVVSKQGAFIARTLLLGMMQGIADAFGKNTNYGVGLSQGGQLSLQQSTDQTTGGAISGAGKGLDKVADFYLQQAVAMFPVIEVNAGRSIDLVLTQGLKAKLPTISGG